MNWLPESLVMLGRGVAPLIWLPTLIAVLGGVGMWLLLPHKESLNISANRDDQRVLSC